MGLGINSQVPIPVGSRSADVDAMDTTARFNCKEKMNMTRRRSRASTTSYPRSTLLPPPTSIMTSLSRCSSCSAGVCLRRRRTRCWSCYSTRMITRLQHPKFLFSIWAPWAVAGRSLGNPS